MRLMATLPTLHFVSMDEALGQIPADISQIVAKLTSYCHRGWPSRQRTHQYRELADRLTRGRLSSRCGNRERSRFELFVGWNLALRKRRLHPVTLPWPSREPSAGVFLSSTLEGARRPHERIDIQCTLTI